MDQKAIYETIDEVRKLARQCEADISIAVGKILKKFRDDTGISPSSVCIDMIEITTLEDVEKNYTVGKTEITLEL